MLEATTPASFNQVCPSEGRCVQAFSGTVDHVLIQMGNELVSVVLGSRPLPAGFFRPISKQSSVLGGNSIDLGHFIGPLFRPLFGLCFALLNKELNYCSKNGQNIHIWKFLHVCMGRVISWVKGSVCFVLKFAPPPFSTPLPSVVENSKQNRH